MTSPNDILSSTEILSIFFDKSLDPSMIFDLEGKIMNVNDSLLTLLNYQKNELIGKSIFYITADKDIERGQNDFKDFGSGKQFPQWHGNYKRKDGSIFPVIVSANQIFHEKSVIGGFAIAKDITEIENVKTQLENFKHALDYSAIVAITDTAGIITYVNKKFCEISKYSKEELLGKNHRILKSGYHNDSFYENMWKTITSGKIWYGDLKNKAKDGTFYWVRTMIMPIFNDNAEIESYIAIRTDITSQIELGEELIKSERMSTIGQLASRISHDIRNPLAIIKVSLENLKAIYGIDDSKQNQFDKVDRSIERITHQIDGVLDFVRELSVELNQEKFSEIITECRDSLIIPDNVKLILSKNDVELLCDKKLFSVAINNLILNGIQSIEGTGTIEITCKENNDESIIQIKDSGRGIPKEDLDKIFEPLFTTKQAGTGLGLASVQSIIKSHGGTISVTSPPTVFTITLPKTSD